MLAKGLKAFGAAAMCLSMLGTVPALGAADKDSSKEPSVDEIKAKRQSVREDLMVPSLEGIRGIAYFVVAPNNVEDYEKIVGEKLHELKVPSTPMRSITSGIKPVDAIVQVKILKATPSDKVSIVQLNVTQWCSLLRNNKLKCKATTYSENSASKDSHLKSTVSEITSQFVINFLKANKKL